MPKKIIPVVPDRIRIDSISPSSGPVGTEITITGVSFLSTQYDGFVRIGELLANIVSWSDEEIKITVPYTISKGIKNITVVTNINDTETVNDAFEVQSVDNATDNITNPVGTYIRNILRQDLDILSLLGITSNESKNIIFFTRPQDQHKGFNNPRLVIQPAVSSINQIGYTGIYEGTESYLISLWMNENPLANPQKLLDRIAYLFNKTSYSFISNSNIANFGTFICSGKTSFPDNDKANTIQGEINITLNIGGIE